MTRICHKPKTNPVQQQQKPQQTQKTGEQNVFAKHLHKKTPKQKTQEKKATKQPKLSTKGKEDQASTRLKQQGAVYGKRGTVADLQAKLDQAKAKSAQQDTKILGDTDASAKELLTDKDSLKLTDSLKDDLGKLEPTIGQPNMQVQGQKEILAGGVIEVKGAKLSPQMLDKIVDAARVGVNATGAPEFQFDLKGDVLGGMQMRMSMENGKLSAIFVSENPEIRKFIDGNLQDLKKILEDRGIYVKDLEIRDPEEDRRQRQREQNQKDRKDAWG